MKVETTKGRIRPTKVTIISKEKPGDMRTRVEKKRVKTEVNRLEPITMSLAMAHLAQGNIILVTDANSHVAIDQMIAHGNLVMLDNDKQSFKYLYLPPPNCCLPKNIYSDMGKYDWMPTSTFAFCNMNKYHYVGKQYVYVEGEVEVTDDTISFGEAIDYLTKNTTSGIVEVAIATQNSSTLFSKFATPYHMMTGTLGNLEARFRIVDTSRTQS